MRLLEFPCGRRAFLPEETTPTPTAEAEDTQPAAETAPPEKLLRRATRGWVPPWRPSLLSISEDGASVGTPRQPATVAKSGGSVKAKAKAKPAVRAVPRATNYGYQYVNVCFIYCCCFLVLLFRSNIYEGLWKTVETVETVRIRVRDNLGTWRCQGT